MKIARKIFLPVISLIGSVIGLVVLVSFSASYGPAHVVSFSIFGSALIILYSVYVAYHLARDTQYESKVKRFHSAAMCVLISGTYTPLYLIAFPSGWGWSMFGVTWGLTLIALLLLFFKSASSELILSIFILVDWLIVVAFYPLYSSVPFIAIKLLALGSAFYTMAAIMDRVGKRRLSQINMLLGSFVHIWCMSVYLLS